MNPGIALLGSCIVMFSLSAGVQAADSAPYTASTSATPAASTGANGAMAATAHGSSGMHATTKHASHAMKHHSMPRRDTAMAATTTGTGDPAYRAALKGCVAGPEGQRDSCIDDAIARFGQS